MKMLAPVGSLLVLLLTTTAQAQVVGGYSTIAPTQIGSSPVFDSQPLYTAQRVEAQRVEAFRELPVEADREARNAALEQVREVDATRSVLRPAKQVNQFVQASFQQPAQFTPGSQPIPVDLKQGAPMGAEYYAPSLNGTQTVPIQASAAVPMQSGACCNPCVSCCMPVQQMSIAQPQYVPQQISVANIPSQLPPDHYFSHGILGQPIVIVEGQPLRNFFRRISP